jgi:hypothetical protein
VSDLGTAHRREIGHLVKEEEQQMSRIAALDLAVFQSREVTT